MKNVLSEKTTRYITAAVLVVVGVGGRVALQDMPNIEPVMAITIAAGMLLGLRLGWLTGLATIVVSDLIIGNTNIAMYTWTAWVVIGLISGAFYIKGLSESSLVNSVKALGVGLTGTIFFYLFTNFGVWHLSGMYAHTWAGLMESYVMGLPFLRNHLMSTMVFVPTVSLAAFTAVKYASLARTHVTEATKQVI